MNTKALFNINYGLYILSTNHNNKDNACIVNTVMQISANPCLVAVSVNKLNFTNDLIKKSKKFNISIITQDAKFDIFKTFGYASGKEVDKFASFKDVNRSKNGLLYITKNINSYICANVTQEIELETHTMFIAEIEDAVILSDRPTVTYDFYQKQIKPQPDNINKSGWRCKICNYIYEGETLPQNYICPICKHGVDDFEKI